MFTTTPRARHRILDFDIENRPLSYIGSDYTSAEVTAIAWCWIEPDQHPNVQVRMLTTDWPASADKMLLDFVAAYNEADIVTGHYIRRHDLPIVNGALLELGHDPLGRKLVSDTKMDLVKRLELPASQEALADMYGLLEEKPHMTQAEWRSANRLTPDGIKLTKVRVVDDVLQHMALRAALLDAGALKTPRVWSP